MLCTRVGAEETRKGQPHRLGGLRVLVPLGTADPEQQTSTVSRETEVVASAAQPH